jgi:hypothetical protein
LSTNIIAGQCLKRLRERAAIEMLHKSDNVAANITIPAVKNLFFQIDCKAVGSAAHRARAAAINATTKPNTAPLAFVLDVDSAGALDDVRGDGHECGTCLMRGPLVRYGRGNA